MAILTHNKSSFLLFGERKIISKLRKFGLNSFVLKDFDRKYNYNVIKKLSFKSKADYSCFCLYFSNEINKVVGNLNISKKIKKLPDNLKCSGVLDISTSYIKKLPNNLEVKIIYVDYDLRDKFIKNNPKFADKIY